GNCWTTSPTVRMRPVRSPQSVVGSQRTSRVCLTRTMDHGPLTLLFHHFLRLLLRHLRDLVFELLEQALHFLLALVALVLGHLLGLLRLVEMLVGVAADIAESDLGILGQLLDARDHF